MSQSNFSLLRTKNILAILDGDANFDDIQLSQTKRVHNGLPYLSGPMICEISKKFGLSAEYKWGGGAKSRWEYMDDLLKYCIDNNRVSDLLAFLLSKEQFVDILKGCTPSEIESAYPQIVTAVIERINSELYFGGHELVRIGNRFAVQKKGVAITIEAPAIKIVDQAYIADLSSRAMKDVAEGNYDSAITKCRTLLEEVFFYVIEKKNEIPSTKGNIGKLYGQVKNLYNMHQQKDQDDRINGLLSGLEKILSAISDMRNKSSDAHGAGSNRIKIEEHHARLFVNSAMTMAEFILSVCEKQTECEALADLH